MLNVDDVTIYLWEKNRVQPSLAQISKIIKFLGRDPFEKQTENLGENIRAYRRIHGLSQRKLAEQLGVDQTTLAGWERGGHHPIKRLLDQVISFQEFNSLKGEDLIPYIYTALCSKKTYSSS